mgnify:CR=1 FL=1|jgi:hypothetical protein
MIHRYRVDDNQGIYVKSKPNPIEIILGFICIYILLYIYIMTIIRKWLGDF